MWICIYVSLFKEKYHNVVKYNLYIINNLRELLRASYQ